MAVQFSVRDDFVQFFRLFRFRKFGNCNCEVNKLTTVINVQQTHVGNMCRRVFWHVSLSFEHVVVISHSLEQKSRTKNDFRRFR